MNADRIAPRSRLLMARTALEQHRRVRLAMRGRSMLPLLREPMIAEVRPLHRRARRGDVLVFECGNTYIAHRVVGFANGDYLTSGDAQPHVVERVAPHAVLGRVAKVWSDPLPDARRVDGLGFRLRGWCYAHVRRLRELRYALGF